MRYLLYIILGVWTGTVAHAAVLGDFSRANCINNESISYFPGDTFNQRAVVSRHYPASGTPHTAGDEDPTYCASPPCPVSPSWREDALCYSEDYCLWSVHFARPFAGFDIGRWAALHSTSGLDASSPFHTPPWTVEGSHATILWAFGYPLYTSTDTGPETGCNVL